MKLPPGDIDNSAYVSKLVKKYASPALRGVVCTKCARHKVGAAANTNNKKAAPLLQTVSSPANSFFPTVVAVRNSVAFLGHSKIPHCIR